MPKKIRKATTPDARIAQLISEATNLAEKKILDGTASSQTINHFLQLGTPKAQLEREILEEQKKLIVAKTDSLQATKKTEAMFREAMKAFSNYSGREPEDDGDEEIWD